MIFVNKIYIAHYSKLIERKLNLMSQTKAINLDCCWFEMEPTQSEIDILYNKNLWKPRILEMKNDFIQERQLKKSEISLEYKHLKIYEDIIKNNIDSALILEDDVILDNDFINKFNFNLSNTPKDWDVIFIGSGCDLHIPIEQQKPHTVAYKKEHPASKCTDSYIIKKTAVEKILKTLIPFCFPIDFELNYQMYINNLNVYWWEPSIVKQGSQNGLYGSSIQ